MSGRARIRLPAVTGRGELGVTHGDARDRNLLVVDSGAHLLDFDSAALSHCHVDAASGVYAWRLNHRDEHAVEAFLGGMVVTVALQVTARRWLRLVDGLGLLPGVADVAPRDPVAVQRHLNAEQADSAGREALEARGVVAPLRDDVWALAVAGGLRRHEQVTLIAGRLAGDRVGPVGMDELTVGVDLLLLPGQADPHVLR